MNKSLISVIVPCYNEESGLSVFYTELSNVINNIENYSFEIIFIDDGSKDSTGSMSILWTKI